ncbi:MAG TPA: penicillin acylase family protein [Rubricoccaceae bacterium]|nr:penicillin acylase family protein [Rubricoccaceae bacterium]
MASRVLLVLASLLVLLIGVAALVSALAYGPDAKRAGSMALEGLSAPASLSWDDGRLVIEASTEADLFAALGYAHAADRAWAMTLWRQAALGELAGWFGAEQRGLDHHARRLGFAALARQSYDSLAPPARALLDAYARGVSLALSENAVAERDEFVLFDVRPEPWAPWHTLAVERLVAWLGTPAPATDSAFVAAARVDRALRAFAAADSSFRAFLLLGGMEHARAWIAPDGRGHALVQTHPYGASALPLFQDATLRVGGRSVVAATVPGTLLLPGGQDDTRAWAVFLTSALALERTLDTAPPPVFDRLTDRDGRETLLAFTRSGEGLYLAADPIPPPPPPRPPLAPRPVAPDSLRRDSAQSDATPADTAPPRPLSAPAQPPRAGPPTPDSLARPAPPRGGWRIRWPGFRVGTDLAAWHALLMGLAPRPFRFFRGDGLALTEGGQTTVLGAPPVRQPLPGGVFVGAAAPARYAAERLGWLLARADSIGGSFLHPAVLAADTYSPWAAETLPPLLIALGPRRLLPDSLRDAYAFLRGWDYRYADDAIGASIFEAWLAVYRTEAGRFPTGTPAERPALLWSLGQATSRLKRRYGAAAAGWRWALVQPGPPVFPVWSGLAADARLARTRYAPPGGSYGGHPTTLQAASSPLFPGVDAPLSWTAWTSTARWDHVIVRHPVLQTRGFLARLGDETAARPYVLRRDAPLGDVLTLRPRRARRAETPPG